MAAVTIRSDFGVQENKICHQFHFTLLFALNWWDWMPWFSFFECWIFKPAFSFSSFTLIKRLFSSSFLSAIRVVSSAYLRLLICLLAVLIPACASFSLAFHMVHSAYKLNKLGDSIQPWCTPFHSIVTYQVLNITSWHAYRSLRSQVWWSSIPIFWIIFHSLLWSTLSKALA